MNKINFEPIIIEDVVYYKKTPQGLMCTAQDSFYYQFLMEHADDSINGQNNCKAATDFLNYEKIFVYLLELEILNHSNYCLDFCPIEGGATFSFNLTYAMDDYDIETMLFQKFADEDMEKYIHQFCNPTEGLKCDICGCVSLSRHLSYLDDNKNKLVFCFGCHPLKQELKDKIKSVFETEGIIAAAKERIRLIDEACKVQIAPNKTINILLDEFIAQCRQPWKKPDPRIDVINQILDEAGRNEFEAFSYENGIALINRKRLADINIFSEVVALNETGDEIVVLFEKAGVCWVDDNAIAFIKKFTDNNDYLTVLEVVNE